MLVWSSSSEGLGTSLTLLPTAAGQPRELPRGAIRSIMDARFLPDGGRILMSASEADRPRRLFVQELPDGLPQPVTPEGIFTENAFAMGDGSWVPAGNDPDTAPYQLYPLFGGDPRPIRGLEKGDVPIRFHADGRLFVRVRSQDLLKATVALLDPQTGRRQPWKVLGPSHPAGVVGLTFVFPSADGRAYVYSYDRILSDLFLVTDLR